MDSTQNVDALRSYIFQSENVQHNRVYFLLVAETIFFAAAVASLNNYLVLIILAASGITILGLFTIVNLKNWFRLLYLTEKLSEVDPTYKEYIQFNDFKGSSNLRGFTERVYHWLHTTPTVVSDDPSSESFRVGTVRWTHTGFLFTWGIFWVLFTTWILLLLHAPIRHIFNYVFFGC